MSFIRWAKGFFEASGDQSVTFLVTFMSACAVVFLVVELGLHISTVDWRVAGTIAGTITAIWLGISYLNRQGNDTRPPGGDRG